MKFLVLLTFALSFNSMAVETSTIKSCNAEEVENITLSSIEWAGENEIPLTARYMLNSKQEIVGAYTYADGEVYAELCEYIRTEHTVANRWYYWEAEFSTNPTEWKKDYHFVINQDEGQAFFKILKASKIGEVTFELKVVGFGDEGEDLVFRKEILTLGKQIPVKHKM